MAPVGTEQVGGASPLLSDDQGDGGDGGDDGAGSGDEGNGGDGGDSGDGGDDGDSAGEGDGGDGVVHNCTIVDQNVCVFLQKKTAAYMAGARIFFRILNLFFWGLRGIFFPTFRPFQNLLNLLYQREKLPTQPWDPYQIY